MILRRSLTIALCASMAACAAQPETVAPTYVSPVTYRSWNCEMLTEENSRLTAEVSRIASVQKENAEADTAAMSIGVLVFVPALFILAATKDHKHELGRLKGEYEAVQLNLTEKKCDTATAQSEPDAAKPTEAAKDEQPKAGEQNATPLPETTAKPQG